VPDTVNVLVWGTVAAGPCAYYRGHQYDEPLKALGVNIRAVTGGGFQPKKGYCIDRHKPDEKCAKEHLAPLEATERGLMEYDETDTKWADVVMFRRYYNTAYKCATIDKHADFDPNGCHFRTSNEEEAAMHSFVDANGASVDLRILAPNIDWTDVPAVDVTLRVIAGDPALAKLRAAVSELIRKGMIRQHGYQAQDNITRDIWPAFRDKWLGGLLYETDDNAHAVKRWNGYYGDIRIELDLVEAMARRADVVTVATPALGEVYGRYNSRVRVIRNSIDPSIYVKDTPRPEGDKPRLVYYGSVARMRDYAGLIDDSGGVARRAVDAHKSELTRVFLGTEPGEQNRQIIAHFFDEQHPKVDGIPQFARALANLHGDIGIAPLGGDEFDACKSELHWLEYSLCDMAFIGQRMMGPSPYNIVRDGVDGILARGVQSWHDAVRSLTRSKDLREQMAGAAKERVLREYDYRDRAREWADAFRFAAENPMIGKSKAA
jgi:glycosyltransferase involved in cell wall biosynthesis